MKKIKELKKELNAIYSDYRAEYEKEDLFNELYNFVIDNDLEVDELYNYTDDEGVEEVIKFNLDAYGWDLMDLVNFMRGVNFDRDDLYILNYGDLKNVTVEDLRDLKDAIEEELERISHVLTVEKVSNCYIYGVALKAYKVDDYGNKIFDYKYKEKTFDLSPAWDEFDEEGEEGLDAIICEDLEDQLIDDYINDYLEENNINREKVRIVDYIHKKEA